MKLDAKGFVIVDPQRRTGDPRILAIGDVAGEPMLAHKASHEAKNRAMCDLTDAYASAIASWGMGILPEHLLNDMALEEEARRVGKDPATFSMRDSRFNEHPVGCGPFKFAEWKSDQHILLDRFEDYWEGAPNYKRYVVRIIPDILTQEMEFYAGTIDGYGVQPHQVARLKTDTRFQNFSGTSFGYSYIGYNLRREPFNDPRVRQALGMALDRSWALRSLFQAPLTLATGPYHPASWAADPGVSPLPFDPAKSYSRSTARQPGRCGSSRAQQAA